MFKVRQNVQFTDEDRHERMLWCYPPTGQIGTIIKVEDDRTVLVDWGADSEVEYNGIQNGYVWWCAKYMLEAVDAES